MIRCPHCYQKVELLDGFCPVCTLHPNKTYRIMNKKERNIRSKIVGIYLTALTHLCIAIALPYLLLRESDWTTGAITGFGALHFLIFLLLSKFSLLGYRLAVVYYFAYGMVCVVTIQRSNFGEQGIGLILCFIALYLIGNQTAKSLFEKSLPRPQI